MNILTHVSELLGFQVLVLFVGMGGFSPLPHSPPSSLYPRLPSLLSHLCPFHLITPRGLIRIVPPDSVPPPPMPPHLFSSATESDALRHFIDENSDLVTGADFDSLLLLSPQTKKFRLALGLRPQGGLSVSAIQSGKMSTVKIALLDTEWLFPSFTHDCCEGEPYLLYSSFVEHVLTRHPRLHRAHAVHEFVRQAFVLSTGWFDKPSFIEFMAAAHILFLRRMSMEALRDQGVVVYHLIPEAKKVFAPPPPPSQTRPPLLPLPSPGQGSSLQGDQQGNQGGKRQRGAGRRPFVGRDQDKRTRRDDDKDDEVAPCQFCRGSHRAGVLCEHLVKLIQSSVRPPRTEQGEEEKPLQRAGNKKADKAAASQASPHG